MAVILSVVKIKYSSKKEQLKRAVTILGAADRLRAIIESSPTPVEQVEYERELAALREKLGTPEFKRAWDAGQMLSMEEVIGLAIQPG